MDVSGQKGFCPIYKCIATAEDNDGELAATLWEQIDEGENSVSFTDVQDLSETQKSIARKNIGAISADEVIPVNTDEGLSDKYDLKDGYDYVEDVYIDESGIEQQQTGKFFKCVDYIPVRANIRYVMYGIGYALYDQEKNYISKKPY